MKINKFPNIRTMVVDGFNVHIGMDLKSSDYLTFRQSDKDDYWFHVKGYSGSQIILKIKNNLPTKEAIYKVGLLAKKYSKADNIKEEITVYYYKRKYVKKIATMRDGQVEIDTTNAYTITL